MATTIEQIKEKLSIVDIVSGYITLEKSGANFKARCPFHNEKTPSFYISPDRGSFYCFGCSEKGDIFTFVEKFEGLDFKGALSVLALRAGVPIVYEKKNNDEKDELFRILELATQYYINNLSSSKGAISYVLERGVTEKTINDFRIGYATDDWRGLHTFLRKACFSDILIERAGLSKKSDKQTVKDSEHYDRFRNRIIFPITDSSGRTIAFSGRTLSSDPNTPKYLNSPETSVFKKSGTLFGIQFAKHEIRKRDYTILVEGQFDLVLLHQNGFTNAVASSGTAVSEGVGETLIKTLSRFSNNLMLCFDGDTAGIKASIRTSKIALKIGMDVKVATLPVGFDPADIMKKDPKLFVEAIKSASHVIYFVSDYLKRVSKDDRLFMRNIKTIVLPLVKTIGSALEREVIIQGLSKKIGISEASLVSDLVLDNIELKYKNQDIPEQKNVKSDALLERLDKIFGIIFLLEEKKMGVDIIDLSKKKLESFLPGSVYLSISKDILSRRNELIFEAELLYQTKALEKHLQDLIFTTEEVFLKKKQQELLLQIKSIEVDNIDPTLLVGEYDKLSKKIDELKEKRLNQDY